MRGKQAARGPQPSREWAKRWQGHLTGNLLHRRERGGCPESSRAKLQGRTGKGPLWGGGAEPSPEQRQHRRGGPEDTEAQARTGPQGAHRGDGIGDPAGRRQGPEKMKCPQSQRKKSALQPESSGEPMKGGWDFSADYHNPICSEVQGMHWQDRRRGL